MDAFEIYRQWFRHHYGRDFVCTREQWNTWCRRGVPNPHFVTSKLLDMADARTIDILADQAEIDRERKEGWAYGH